MLCYTSPHTFSDHCYRRVTKVCAASHTLSLKCDIGAVPRACKKMWHWQKRKGGRGDEQHSALGLLSHVIKHPMFNPLQSYPAEGISSLELPQILTPLPKTCFGERIKWGLVCACEHSITRTYKKLTFMSHMGECHQEKKHHKSNIHKDNIHKDYGRTESSHTCKILPTMVNPRDLAGERKRRRRWEKA